MFMLAKNIKQCGAFLGKKKKNYKKRIVCNQVP